MQDYDDTTQPDDETQGQKMLWRLWHYLRTRRLECWGFFLAGLFIGKLFF